MGASQEDLLKFNNGVAAALKIQGSSASQAQGALLQLSQALGSGIVRAEEFNSVNEGALPILKAVAANLDGAGGSIAKLKNLVNDGKVTSEAFFRAFLKGSADLEAQAAKTNLIIGASFLTLNNALGKYIGEADQSLSATQRVAAGITLLADNLDQIIPAIAALSVGMGVRYVASALAAGGATRALGASLAALKAHPVVLGLSVLAAGVAYLAFTTKSAAAEAAELTASIDQQAEALGVVMQRQREADAASGKLDDAQRRALVSTANLTGEAHLLADAWARVAAEAKKATLAQAEKVQQTARDNLRKAEDNANEAGRRAVTSAQVRAAAANVGPLGASPFAPTSLSADEQDKILIKTLSGAVGKEVAKARAVYLAASRDLKEIEERGLAEFKRDTTTPTAKAKKPKGPTQAEIEQHFLSDLEGEYQRTVAARRDLTTSVEERSDLEKQAMESALARYKAEIQADEHYSNAQKAKLVAAADVTAALERERIERDKQEALAQQALDVTQAQIDNSRDLLGAEADLTDKRDARRDLELRLLDLSRCAKEASMRCGARSRLRGSRFWNQARPPRLAERASGALKSTDIA